MLVDNPKPGFKPLRGSKASERYHTGDTGNKGSLGVREFGHLGVLGQVVRDRWGWKKAQFQCDLLLWEREWSKAQKPVGL